MIGLYDAKQMYGVYLCINMNFNRLKKCIKSIETIFYKQTLFYKNYICMKLFIYNVVLQIFIEDRVTAVIERHRKNRGGKIKSKVSKCSWSTIRRSFCVSAEKASQRGKCQFLSKVL